MSMEHLGKGFQKLITLLLREKTRKEILVDRKSLSMVRLAEPLKV
jgi:hypothetical protein